MGKKVRKDFTTWVFLYDYFSFYSFPQYFHSLLISLFRIAAMMMILMMIMIVMMMMVMIVMMAMLLMMVMILIMMMMVKTDDASEDGDVDVDDRR